MRSVDIDLGPRSYTIRIGSGLLGDPRELLAWLPGEQVMVITNQIVAPRYLDTLKRGLHGKRVFDLILPDGEQTKTLDTLEHIFDRLVDIRGERTLTLIALGGGVVGDLSGFAAACYLRGVAFIQVPTTLLAQVDSSVGGKTGVNHPQGKNLLGAFYQPRRVLADIDTLASLPAREFSAGLAEVIKYGASNDAEFFAWLEQNLPAILRHDRDALPEMVARACTNKAQIVEQDEREAGRRALLNFGHTFGHAIEAGLGYGQWLHGEAVALGMVMAATMSHRSGRLAAADLHRLIELLKRAALPVHRLRGLTATQMLAAMQLDKKIQHGHLRLILLNRIGQAEICQDYAESDLSATLEEFCE